MVFSFSLTLVPLHKVFNKCWWDGGSLAWWAIAFSALYQGDGGVPHWGTHPMSVLLILLHSPCRLHLHFRTERQTVAGQLVMLWCFGAWYGQKEGLPHCQQTYTSRASGIRSGFGLLGTTLCFQPRWGWKYWGCRGTERAWNPRTRRITCLVERVFFFAFIPVPCCSLMHLT